jgi:hypothetical protein
VKRKRLGIRDAILHDPSLQVGPYRPDDSTAVKEFFSKTNQMIGLEAVERLREQGFANPTDNQVIAMGDQVYAEMLEASESQKEGLTPPL